VLAVASNIVAKAGRPLRSTCSTVTPSRPRSELAQTTGKDARMVEVILLGHADGLAGRENALVVPHHGGQSARTRAVDQSNASRPRRSWALGAAFVPADPNASAARSCGDRLRELCGRDDRRESWTTRSVARFEKARVGVAIGVAGMPALDDQRRPRRLSRRSNRGGDHDGTGCTSSAGVCDLVAGQADEARRCRARTRPRRLPSSEQNALAVMSACGRGPLPVSTRGQHTPKAACGSLRTERRCVCPAASAAHALCHGLANALAPEQLR